MGGALDPDPSRGRHPASHGAVRLWSDLLVVEPLQRLSYNWGVGGNESGLQWVVLLTLTPVEGGTQLRMEQSGFGQIGWSSNRCSACPITGVLAATSPGFNGWCS